MSDVKTLKFCLFSDYHYKYKFSLRTVGELGGIFDRAHNEGAAFVMHCGDFSNDYIGSPEITNAFLKNKYDLPAYGLYGNHELEAPNNSMQVVTPLLTNREVVWGTPDGKIGDGSIAYYYFDVDGFRMVFTDTNYSIGADTGEWEHNPTCSYNHRPGNKMGDSLGPVQLEWLEGVLTDAAHKGLKCIVASHASFTKWWRWSPDWQNVQDIYRRVNAIRKGTVILSLNGHYHTDNAAKIEDVVYIDVNSSSGGLWIPGGYEHYSDDMTYTVYEYDDEGNELGCCDFPISQMTMAKNSWWFADPLSAIVTVTTDGGVKVEGSVTKWIYDVVPTKEDAGDIPISTEIRDWEF